MTISKNLLIKLPKNNLLGDIKMEDRVQSDGAIYVNNYKNSDKQPDWTGKVALDKTLLKALVENIKAGEEAEMRIALWDRVSKNGNEYKYSRLDIPQPQNETKSAPAPAPVKQAEELSDDDIPF